MFCSNRKIFRRSSSLNVYFQIRKENFLGYGHFKLEWVFSSVPDNTYNFVFNWTSENIDFSTVLVAVSIKIFVWLPFFNFTATFL